MECSAFFVPVLMSKTCSWQAVLHAEYPADVCSMDNSLDLRQSCPTLGLTSGTGGSKTNKQTLMSRIFYAGEIVLASFD